MPSRPMTINTSPALGPPCLGASPLSLRALSSIALMSQPPTHALHSGKFVQLANWLVLVSKLKLLCSPSVVIFGLFLQKAKIVNLPSCRNVTSLPLSAPCATPSAPLFSRIANCGSQPLTTLPRASRAITETLTFEPGLYCACALSRTSFVPSTTSWRLNGAPGSPYGPPGPAAPPP